ncbi:hypothetical protein ACLOJK_006486 [Asimina triloba]
MECRRVEVTLTWGGWEDGLCCGRLGLGDEAWVSESAMDDGLMKEEGVATVSITAAHHTVCRCLPSEMRKSCRQSGLSAMEGAACCHSHGGMSPLSTGSLLRCRPPSYGLRRRPKLLLQLPTSGDDGFWAARFGDFFRSALTG